MLNRLWSAAVGAGIVSIVALCAAFAYYETFSSFWWYDDEGILMLAVQHMLDGHRLYTEIPFGYGPLLFLVRWLLYGALGLSLTHDAVRLAAIAARLLAAALGAGAVARITRHPALGGVAFLAITLDLIITTYEPGHPQELAAVLVVAIGLVATTVREDRALRAFAGLGLIVAGLAMLKINIGVFAGIAAWMAVVSSMPVTWPVVVLWILSLAPILAMPGLLMRAHLSVPWGFTFASCATGWIAAAAVASRPRRDGSLRWLHLVVLAGAGIIGSMIFVGTLMARGTSLGSLFDSLAIGPQVLINLFSSPLPLGPGARWAAVAGVVGALVATVARRWADNRPGVTVLVGCAKLLLGAFVVRQVLRNQPTDILGFGAPVAWLVVLGGRDDPWGLGQQFARLVLAWLAVLIPLQAYPVPGSQQWLGALPLVLCALICLGDAGDTASALLPARCRQIAGEVATAAALLATLLLVEGRLVAQRQTYVANVPLGQPGASRLRVPGFQATEFRDLVNLLREHCRPFIAVPGLNSLYFWTGQKPPTLDLISEQIAFIPPERQEALLAALARSPNACIVRGPSMVLPDPHFTDISSRAFPRLSWQTRLYTIFTH